MGYFVRITARAERDLQTIFDVICAEDSLMARKWYLELKAAIVSLEEQPNRCPQTPENPKVRHLLHGVKPHVYRVIFEVKAKSQTVIVLHVRHGARKPFKTAELR